MNSSERLVPILAEKVQEAAVGIRAAAKNKGKLARTEGGTCVFIPQEGILAWCRRFLFFLSIFSSRFLSWICLETGS